MKTNSRINKDTLGFFNKFCDVVSSFESSTALTVDLTSNPWMSFLISDVNRLFFSE